ncbi:MAG: choice-of-anchor J domain-containing protein, partial [Ignavibacteria bacterium]|nr:choice-of-anchor J domain-containing protein [Ignavibacteria bacterium]
MKKLITILLIVFVAFMVVDLSAQTGSIWQWQHPSPQGNALRYVKYWDANNWYAVGYGGTFMKTTNAGTTWTFNHMAGVAYGPSGQKTFMYDAHFINQTTGIVVGSGSATAPDYHFGIVRTTNGGTTWDSVASNPFQTGIFYKVFFLNSTVGYAAGTTTPKLYKTTNAGVSWEGVTTAPTGTLYDVYAWDTTNIICCSSGGSVYKTTNAGLNWTTISSGASATQYKIDFMDANTGFIAGATTFRYTTNAGLNWTVPANMGMLPTAFYDLKYKSASTTIPQKLSEGFESTTFPPTGWTSKNVAGTNVWLRSTGQFHSGTASAFINYETAGGNDWLVTPKINGIAATDSLKFWWKNLFSSAYPPDSLIIRVSTTDTAVASFTGVIARINSATAPFTWTEFKYSLSAYAGQNIHIAFHHFNTDGNGGFLDDVTVGPPAGPGLVTSIYLTGNSFAIHKTTNFGTSWDTVGHLSPTQPWTSTYYASDLSLTGDTIISVGAFGLINRRMQASNTRQCLTSFLRAG